MQNQFDTAHYPDAVPAELVAGARWAWTRADITLAYPTASYTLTFRLLQLIAPFAVKNVIASKISAAHVVEVVSANTTGTALGDYTWQAIIARDSDGEKVQVDQGLLTIQPDLIASGESYSWVYQVLIAIRATLKKTASKEQSSYSIGGRSLSNRTPLELLEMEKEFTDRWRREQSDIEKNAGRRFSRRVLVKMGA